MSDVIEQGAIGDVLVQRDVPSMMSDGTVLRADVYRPRDAGPLPVLVQRTPYGKAVAQQITYQHPAWYARQGYVVVVQDCRGRFGSDGDFWPYRNEAKDTADTIQWAAQLPGVNGKVGTYGFSYAGALQLLGAAERPGALACVAPGFTGSDFYDGWTFVGGALNHAFLLSWVEQMLAIPDAIKKGDVAAARSLVAEADNFPRLYRYQPLAEFGPFKTTGTAPYFFEWLEHDTRDEYWEALSVRERHDRVQVPALHFGGWYDTFIEGTLENFSKMSAIADGDPGRLQRLVVGPWHHLPWAATAAARDFGPEAANNLDEVNREWFDFWLKGSGSLAETPAVRLFVMGRNRWSEFDQWPPAGVEFDTLYLRSSGRATSLSGDGSLSGEKPTDEPPDVFVFNPAMPVPSLGGRSCCSADITPMGPYDQAPVETRNDVLVFSSSILKRGVEVIGTVELVLYAATDAVDTDWTVKLVDVDESGVAVNLCDSIMRASCREGLDRRVPVARDRVYEYRISVGSTANVFAQGHRIRLEISSSNFPLYDVNHNNGQRSGEASAIEAVVATQAVFHDASRPSRLLLPVLHRN